MSNSLPIIDVSSLSSPDQSDEQLQTATAIGEACQRFGFFYIVGHQVPIDLQQRLDSLSRQFFDLPLQDKLSMRMELAGRAWRGYFPLGAELTSGRPDHKEGLYFGEELAADHPQVQAGAPMHGANLFPPIDGFREVVLEYMRVMTSLGHQVLRGVALSLGLPKDVFESQLTRSPFVLFRIFHYPSLDSASNEQASVGEHTDYGLLTLLRQDLVGGLQIRMPKGWIDAPPVENSFVCNLGDILELMTRGAYRSTPHRVRNTSHQSRLSFPFFFDPNFAAELAPLDLPNGVCLPKAASSERHLPDAPAAPRWDNQDVSKLSGTYGDYILSKVAKVFPDLE